MPLSSSDREILDFEGSWWLNPGAKSVAIRRDLDMAASTYYKRLSTIIDDPEAMTADPLLVRRLRRDRADRRRTRHTGPRWKRSHP
ncbi:DUF3263 domain-containing protein [Actinospongicola halichondriae]|uniref:DUF3263 domain-containing protein n=1 Tax=Actinospongicola halichondriae TaxID=3236844 RepID=UPI003D39D90E